MKKYINITCVKYNYNKIMIKQYKPRYCSDPSKLNKLQGSLFMKLTYEDKIEIYRLRKEEHLNIRMIADRYKIGIKNIKYLVDLINLYGIAIAKKKNNRKYSIEFKEVAINRVLLGNESQEKVSLSLALPGRGTLSIWIKLYIKNGYNVVVKKRGRHAKKETADKRIRTFEENTRTSKEELAAIDRERILKKINAVPDVPHITRSDYYYTINKIDKDDKNQELIEKIKETYSSHKKRYGYRRITLELARQNINVNHKKVQRLMQKFELKGITPRAKYRSYKGDFNGTVKNLLLDKVIDTANHKTYYDRNFKTTSVNQKWTTDVSEFHIAAGKLYLSPILDMHNAEIVSFNISTAPNFYQTVDMLNKAFDVHTNLNGLIFHSDQGWQYQMEPYHTILRGRDIIQSMSRKGNCYDNGIMENFFGKMKNEMFYGHEYEFKTLEELRTAMEEYIDYYNTKRIQVKLKGRTPCESRNSTLKCP